jgi:hypothetical protein
MSNILFSKKFLAKLTAIIRNFWWTGVKNVPNTKALCLRAWADICTEKKKIGGLGVRNLQAINQSLILSVAWRLAKEPRAIWRSYLNRSITATPPFGGQAELAKICLLETGCKTYVMFGFFISN